MATAPSRWVRAGDLESARRYSWATCRFCGRAQAQDCPVAVCMLCATAQCHGHGGGSGCCAVCHHGYLPGWSRGHIRNARVCGYAGCENDAVAIARKRPVCIAHAQRVKVTGGLTLAEYVAVRLAHRDSGAGWERWALVDG